MADDISVLVVGVGSIGERHVRCFQHTGRVRVSICELNDGLRRDIAGRYEIAESYADYDEAVAAGHDAVVICTPAHLHINMALKAVAGGSHVLIEKPLSTSLADVDELINVVDESGKVAMVAYVSRVNPGLEALHDVIQQEQFGKPLQLILQGGQHFPKYRPAYREIYYTDHATGGGAIQDGLTHTVNLAEWLVGPIDRVVADAQHMALPGVTVEDTVHVIARHGDVMVSYVLNQHQAPNESTLLLVCQRGTLRFVFHEQRLESMVEPGGEWHLEARTELERDDNFVRQADRFLDAIAGKSPPTCTLREGLSTLRANLAILRSVESGQWETV